MPGSFADAHIFPEAASNSLRGGPVQTCSIPGVVLQAGDLMAATDKFWITFAGMPVGFGAY